MLNHILYLPAAASMHETPVHSFTISCPELEMEVEADRDHMAVIVKVLIFDVLIL